MNNKEIKKNLQSGKTDLIMDTLKFISEKGNKDILIDIIDLLHSSSESIVQKEIIKILDNLKLQDCSPIVIDAIKNKKYENELSVLVSSCWKNSLNFEEYIEVFIEVFIKKDFLLAFEAFTVIDNFDNANAENSSRCLLSLENSVEDIAEDKRLLYFELINIVKVLKENPA